MNSRTLIMLSLVIFVLGCAWYVVEQQNFTTELAVPLLYPRLLDRAGDAKEILVESAVGTVTVSRRNGNWMVNELDGYPAAVAVIRRALMEIAALHIVEVKTNRPDKYPVLGVEGRPLKRSQVGIVKIMDEKDASIVDLVIGKERVAQTPGSSGNYVRRNGEANAYLAEGELRLGSNPTDWVNTEIVDLDATRIQRVVLQPDKGEAIVVDRADPKATSFTLQNIPEGQEVSASTTVSGIGSLMLQTKFEKVVKAAAVASGTPRAIATVETFDGLVGIISYFPREKVAYVTLKFTQSAGKSSADLAKEIATLNARVGGWAYVLPEDKANLLKTRFSELVQKKARQGRTPVKATMPAGH